MLSVTQNHSLFNHPMASILPGTLRCNMTQPSDPALLPCAAASPAPSVLLVHVKRPPLDEGLDHGQSPLRLIQGYHVPRLVHLEEGEVGERAGQPRLLALHHPLVVPLVVEPCAALPLEGERPGLVAHVVADVVHISSVDQGLDASLEHFGNRAAEAVHPILVKTAVDHEIARAPLVPLRPQLGNHLGVAKEALRGAEVVAEGGVLALLADVVEVQAGRLHRGDLGESAEGERRLARLLRLLAHPDLRGAQLRRELHSLVRCLGHDGSHGARVGHLAVVKVLDLGGGEPVADGDAREGEVGARLLHVAPMDR
mmetsp:Transcript_3726/g.8880  ORF Transcript_3726/g.8880 Transcript_3726/m.8880 type:complete len:312 (+) Transcript_3726:1378-2313(+)